MSPSVAPPRVQAGESLPAVLVLREVGELLGLSHSRTYELYHAGEFRRFEIVPRLGNRPRFSGARLQAWIDGTEEAPSPTAGSRYFASARRAR